MDTTQMVVFEPKTLDIHEPPYIDLASCYGLRSWGITP